MRILPTPLRRRPAAVLLALGLVALAACSSGTATSTTTTTAPASSTTATGTGGTPVVVQADPAAGLAAYAERGPYAVGMVTLDVGGRPVDVWYPAPPGSDAGKPQATYDLREWLPPAEAAKLPADLASSFTMEAVRDLPPAGGGPFPVVVFSHGFAGYRDQSTFLTTHLASYGMVVVAPDHPSRDLSMALGAPPPAGPNDVGDLAAALDAVLGATSGPLAGLADPERVAGVGHSAGGEAVYRLAAERPAQIDTYVALSQGPGRSRPGDTAAPPAPPALPSLVATGSTDVIIPVDVVRTAWAALPGPTRLAVLDGASHLAPMDICTIAADQGGVLEVARANGVAVSEIVLRLFADGCSPPNVPAEQTWPAWRHLVTAHLRSAWGLDAQPIGLDDGVSTTYPFAVEITSRPA